MSARDLSDSEQVIDERSQYARDQIADTDQFLLLEMGFKLTAKTPIGGGAYGNVFRGEATKEAIRFHPIADINGDYFEEIFEGKVIRYLPVSDTDEFDKNYRVESLKDREVDIKYVIMFGSSLLSEQADARREAQIMARLHHPNIVDIYDGLIVGWRLYIVLEYCSHGNLNNFLLQQRLSQQLCMTFVQNLGAGMLYMHDQGVTHGDIHEHNVLVFVSGPNGEHIALKYVDFGLGVFVTITDLTPIENDVRNLSGLFFSLSMRTDFADAALQQRFQDLFHRLAQYVFKSMREAISEYEFLHPEEYARMNPTV